MRGFSPQLEQIQLLVDKIQHHLIYNAGLNPYEYEKLLLLSTQMRYSYGVALAHAYLARYAHAVMDADAYHTHLEEAEKIARSKNYFDVLMQCAQLEGNRNSALCNEVAALSSFMEGLTLSTETKNWQACFTFYKEIAELFSDCGVYEDAQAFHQKALHILEERHIPNGNFYRYDILLRLLRLACMLGDLEQAQQNWRACLEKPCTLGNLPLLFSVEEIRLLLLRGETQTANQKTDSMLQALRQDKRDAELLQPVYLYAMELLLCMKRQESAAWCLNRIETLYPKVNRKTAIWLQKLRVQYAGDFGPPDDGVYQRFYQVTQQSETANRASTAETFHSLIALYESAKEQNRMMEERTGLQTALDRDELTQIYNRRYFSKLISKHLQDNRISSLDCVMVDVDYFKAYNDHYGHLKGDHILKQVASLLVACLPEDAFAARYGGDEFACLLVDKTEDELIAFVKQVQSELDAKKIPHAKNRNGDLLTLSFGINRETDLKGCDEHQILSRADQALYRAKKSDRNTYVVYVQGREM